MKKLVYTSLFLVSMVLIAACGQTANLKGTSQTLTKQFIVDGVGYTPEEISQFEGGPTLCS